jgi:hypothetical protein
MCAVRRGIDERDYRDLTGIDGCCARAHRLAMRSTRQRCPEAAFSSLASGWGKGILSALANTLIEGKIGLKTIVPKHR